MPHDKKFRFGVQTSIVGSASEWRDRAKKMEDLGYSTLFMPDHFIETQLAPMVAISVGRPGTPRTTLSASPCREPWWRWWGRQRCTLRAAPPALPLARAADCSQLARLCRR